MNQKFSSLPGGLKQRDWRIPDPSSPLQHLVRKTSVHFNQTPLSSQSTTGVILSKPKDVAKPTTFSKFLVILLMHVCRKILFIELKFRLIVYLSCTIVISLITDHFPPPGCFLSDSTNLLNQYFVKYAWTITCGVLAIFIYLTSKVFYCGQLYGINRNLSRLAILAIWWYLCSFIFDHIAYRYGFCIGGSNTGQERFNRDLCLGRWISFTISDRAFLMLYSMIAISEEIKALVSWEKLNETFSKRESDVAVSELREKQVKISKKIHEENSTYVKAIVMILTVLILILDLANFGTIIYFNNMPQKLIANLFAILGWLITYKMWFVQKPHPSLNFWCPGIPGQNVFIANR